MYTKVGNKWVKVVRIDHGIPVLEGRTEVIKKDDGSQDVIVHVPFLEIRTKEENRS